MAPCSADTRAVAVCQQATTSFIGAAGYSLGLFNISLASGSQTLWQKNDTLLQAGSCQ
jgi:hypothetical protein